MTQMCTALTMFAAVALTDVGDTGKKSVLTKDETKIFELTNQERKAKNAPALKLNATLCKVARAHSENMAKQGKFDHTLDEKSPFDRLRDAGYKYLKAAENLAMGEKGASNDAIMKVWMESELHRTNLLNADYVEIGIGIATDKSGQTYYTQVFGTQRK